MGEAIRQDFMEDSMLAFLDGLRERGTTNMFETVPSIQKEFPVLSEAEAKYVLVYWMETFGKEKR